MGEETKRVTIKDFTGGINQAVEPTKIKENEFFNLHNFIVCKIGSIGNLSKRKGLEIWNTGTAPTNNFSANQIYQYISNSKTSNFDRLILKTNNSLEYTPTGTTTAGYTSIDASDVTGKVKFLTYRDNLYIFNRNTAGTYANNKYYNGTNYLDMGLPPTPQTFTLTEDTKLAGGLPNGTYKYFITYVYDGLYESFPLIQNTSSAQSYDISVQFKSLTVASTNACYINSIPIGNVRVTARRIYRTKVGGTIFYLHSEIADNTTTFVIDEVADTSLIEPQDLSFIFQPPIAKYGIEHNGYMFLANLKENTNKAPDIAGISYTSDASTGNLTTNGTRRARYGYKFCELNIIPTLTSSDGKPFQGYYGDFASFNYIEVENIGDTEIKFSALPNANQFTGRIGVFRNTCMFPSSTTSYPATSNPAQVTFTVAATTGLAIGDTVIIDGFSSWGGGDDPNGTFTITGISATEITINFDTGAYTTYTNEGRIMGGNYYFEGYPTILSHTDDNIFTSLKSDADIVKNKLILSLAGLEPATDKTLPSTIVWGIGENFDNSIEVQPNDNDVITGLASDDDGVVIFKERNIYKLYTSATPDYWQLRKVYSGIGCSEPYSIVTISSNTHLFMMNGAIYLYSNGNVKRISDKIQPIIDSFGTLTNTDVCYDNIRNWVVWTFSWTQNATAMEDIIVLDLNFPTQDNIGIWYYFSHYRAAITNDDKSLTVKSPIVTKQGLLLFGSTSNRIIYYGKTPQYQDTVVISGSSANVPIYTNLTKYFDFDEWTAKKLRAKVKIGGAGTVYLYFYQTSYGGNKIFSTTTNIGRINIDFNTGLQQVLDLRLTNEANVTLEIVEISFDYTQKHLNRGSF